MIDRRTTQIGLFLLMATFLIQFVAGILAGSRSQWLHMALYFVGSILLALFWTSIMLARKMDASFKRLEEILLRKRD